MFEITYTLIWKGKRKNNPFNDKQEVDMIMNSGNFLPSFSFFMFSSYSGMLLLTLLLIYCHTAATVVDVILLCDAFPFQIKRFHTIKVRVLCSLGISRVTSLCLAYRRARVTEIENIIIAGFCFIKVISEHSTSFKFHPVSVVTCTHVTNARNPFR